jgi:hypothetical protein
MLHTAEKFFSSAKSLRYLSLRYHESACCCDGPQWIEAGSFELVEERPRVLAAHEIVMIDSEKKTKESRFYRVELGDENLC